MHSLRRAGAAPLRKPLSCCEPTPQMNRFGPSRRTAHRAAVVAAIGFGVLVIFQAVLAAGAPLGEAAWGGTDPDLSTAERIASGVAVVVWTSAALLVTGNHGSNALGIGLNFRFGVAL
jgi:hypothetical protein